MYRDKSLRYIFIASLCIAVLFPLLNIFLVYPSFKDLLSLQAEDNARRVARHLGGTVVDNSGRLLPTEYFGFTGDDLMKEYGVLKLKVYSATGYTVYSTEAADVGKVNDRPYFTQVVAAGHEYTKLVTKESRSLEGEVVRADVVETYVPIMHGDKFIGAFEVYYDMTRNSERLRGVVLKYSLIPVASMAVFLWLVTVLLSKVNRGILRAAEAEAELISHRDSLESQVEERTRELRASAESLENEITEHQRADIALKESERFLTTIFDSIYDPFCIFDREFRIVRANEGYARLKGIALQDLLGRKCHELIEGRDTVCPNCVVERTLRSLDPCSKVKETKMQDGEPGWVEIFTYPIFGADGRVSFVIEYTRDITARMMAEMERNKLIKKLEFLSRTDGLTGLLNRRTITEGLEDEIVRARRYGSALSIMLCDLDNFKEINDTYGHTEGDRALVKFSGNICASLRKTDIAGRYGGDEFLLILPETGTKGAVELAERIRESIAATQLDVPGKDILVTMSFGIVALSEEIAEAGVMIREADAALYKSKGAGRNQITIAGAGA